MPGFSIDRFIADVRAIAAQDGAATALRSYMEQVFADPQAVAQGIGGALQEDALLFEDDSISVWHSCFHPGISVPPHDHQMSVVLGVYQGRERNDFYQADPDGGLRRSSSIELGPGDVFAIGPSGIHAVSCLSETACLGLHVYLGNLNAAERSLFDLDSGQALRFDWDNYERLMAADRDRQAGPGA